MPTQKLKTFQHHEFSRDEYSSVNIIKKKINNLEDLFNRNHKYEKIEINNSYPEYIKNNFTEFKEFIL